MTRASRRVVYAVMLSSALTMSLACSSSSPHATTSDAGTRSSGSGSGSGSSGSGAPGLDADTITGMVGDAALQIRGATAVIGSTSKITGSNAYIALLGFTSGEDATCKSLESNTGQLASTSTLTILLISKTPIQAMRYDVLPAPELPAVSAVYNDVNATCASVLRDAGGNIIAGFVIVTALTRSSITGTYALRFNDGDIEGSFSIPLCQGLNIDEIFTLPDAGIACIQP
jgi:hypothetical protein